jgi:hypothetical protein
MAAITQVAGLSPRRPEFVPPESVHVGFVVDKVALGQDFLLVFQFHPVNIIPPLALHAHLSSRRRTIIIPLVAALRLAIDVSNKK